MGYMYILMCYDGTYYTGSTKDIAVRLEQHQRGRGANYTKKRLPVELVYFEKFPWISHAFEREKQIQKWSHSKKQALIEGFDDALSALAQCQNETHYQEKGNKG